MAKLQSKDKNSQTPFRAAKEHGNFSFAHVSMVILRILSSFRAQVNIFKMRADQIQSEICLDSNQIVLQNCSNLVCMRKAKLKSDSSLSLF